MMTARQRILVLLFLCVVPLLAEAQLKKADEAFDHHHYAEAIEYYDKAIRKDLDNDHAITRMAICFWRTNQLPEAEYWFTRAALMNDDPEVKRMFAQVLIANGKYALASEWLDKYSEVLADDSKLHYAQQLKQWAMALEREVFEFEECKVVPARINSNALDFAPLIVGNQVYFITNRYGVEWRSGTYDPWTNARFTDVFVADRDEVGALSNPRQAEGIPLTPFHEGPISFSADLQELYMTTSDFDDNKRSFDSENNTRVKIARLRRTSNGSYEFTKALPFYNKEYNTAHPALSPDGRMLVFASDMPGGQGGMDLYVSRRGEDGSWGAPQSLGTHINTSGNEMFPYIHVDGTLYLSSNWHPGFGGMDLFKCSPDGDGWGLPENLGIPMNSPRDDFGVTLDLDGSSGYFSSNRSVEDKDEVLFFKKVTGIRIEGRLIDCANRLPIAGAQVALSGNEYYRDVVFTHEDGSYQFTVQDTADFVLSATHPDFFADGSCAGTAMISTKGMFEGQTVNTRLALSQKPSVNSDQVYLCGRIFHEVYGNPLKDCSVLIQDEAGNDVELQTGVMGTFFVPVADASAYHIEISHPAFHTVFEDLTIAAASDQCHSIDIHLVPDRGQIPPPITANIEVKEGLLVELYHIYFDLDEARLREDAIPDLEVFLQLMLSNPNMTGELMAHTDSRGTDVYNLELSQRRADAVLEWLVQRGIARSRLKAKGYGESMLLNQCSNQADCTEEEHARNRRVEFRVSLSNDQGSITSSENNLTLKGDR